MDAQILHKRSSVEGKEPTASQLAHGELALNYADGVLFYKNGNDEVCKISIGGLAGSPIPWSLGVAPEGYLECRGQAFDMEAYPELAIAYPTGFLPDLRSEFIRGWDNGRGIDTNRVLLSLQDDAIKSHRHTYSLNNVGGVFGSGDSSTARENFTTYNSSYSGSNETRPRNIAFMFIVRAA